MKIIKSSIMIFFAAVYSMVSMANDFDAEQRYNIKGIAVTGANMRLGEPVWHMGEGLGTAAFSFVFGHNPNADEPLDLTLETPMDTLLATGLDQNFLAALGLNASSFTPNPVNIPFHEVPVIVNPFTAGRVNVAPALNVTGSTPSRSGPNNPVTLGQWLEAKGRLKIQCHNDDTATIILRVSGLVPNGVYTVWGLFGEDVTGDGIEDRIVPSAFGGVPNVVIPNDKGHAKFKRELGFCPKDNEHLKLVDVTYHSDGNVYGGTVDMFLPGFPGFAVTNTHVAFPINAEPLK